MNEKTLREMAEGRHPEIVDIVRFFEYSHLPQHLRSASEHFYYLAWSLLAMQETDNPQLTIALQDLLRAKDAFVRSMLK